MKTVRGGSSQCCRTGTPAEGGLPYESDGDARRKIRINTLEETNLGVAPALFNPLGRPCRNRQLNKSYRDVLNCAKDVAIECCLL